MGDRWRPVVVVVAGLVVGGMTSFLQTWLPYEAAPLANSAGPWCAVAYALALLGRRPADAAMYGAAALVALDVGYYTTAAARGFPTSAASVAFWVVAALAVGPVLGIGARWLRARHPVRRACAVAVLPTVFVLEAVRSLAQVGGTTYRPYWVGEAAAGMLLAAVLAVRQRVGRRPGGDLGRPSFERPAADSGRTAARSTP